MAALPVQFYGVDEVLQAAENLKCPAWAVFWGGTNLFSKYEGNDQQESLATLNNTLEILSNSASSARYKIKFFEPDGKPIKINEKTVCNGGSFTFVLTDSEERESKLLGRSSQFGVIGQLQQKISDLEKKLQEAEEVEEEPESIGTIFLDLLKNPGQLVQLVNVGRSLVGLPVQNLGAIGSIDTAQIPENIAAKADRLDNALVELEKSDPRLIEHLEKLAQMARENPDQFKATVSMLDLR